MRLENNFAPRSNSSFKEMLQKDLGLLYLSVETNAQIEEASAKFLLMQSDLKRKIVNADPNSSYFTLLNNCLSELHEINKELLELAANSPLILSDN